MDFEEAAQVRFAEKRDETSAVLLL